MARKKQTLEKALDRLDEIIQTIESGEVGLETALKLYKEGIDLSSYCNESLSVAEEQIFLLKKTAEAFVLEPFDINESLSNI